MRGASVNRYRNIWVLICVATLLAFATPSAAKDKKVESIVVVVHGKSSEKSLGKTDLKNIYLGRRTTWSNGNSVTPYLRPPRSGAGFAFYRNVLKMTPAKYRYHWQSRQLSGRGTIPPTVRKGTQLVKLIAADKGAVGFVTASEARKLEDDVKAERIKLITLR